VNEQIANVIRVLEEFNGTLHRILNIGFRPNSDKTVATWCARHKRTLVHLEAYGPNVQWIRTSKGLGTAVEGDVRRVGEIFEPQSFDFILWLHGPEHVTREEFMKLRPVLEERSAHGVMYQAPIGDRPQGGDLYGNPYEKHLSVLLPIDFERMHYCVDVHNRGTECCFSAIRVW
jgi:hypothetical protein